MEKKIILPVIQENRSHRNRHAGISDIVIAKVIYVYLFEGKSNRSIDREILELDDKKTHGYISMGILHDFGLNADIKGCFKGYELSIVAAEMSQNEGYEEIGKYLRLISNVEDNSLPRLNRSNRKGEYSKYSNREIHDVVCQYLFDGKSHRKLDKEVLKLDSAKSKGYQSMSILHFLGLDGVFKGIFKEKTLKQALSILDMEGDEYSLIKEILELEIDSDKDVIQTTEDNIIVLHIADYSMHGSKVKF